MDELIGRLATNASIDGAVAEKTVQNVARELFRFSREKIGADPMGKIIAGTPGVSQFA